MKTALNARHHRAKMRIDEYRDYGLLPCDVPVMDPRTGAAPTDWGRAEELLVGAELKRLALPQSSRGLTAWQRAVI